MNTPIVLKLGGNEIDDSQFLEQLAHYLSSSHTPTIIVHGGGKEISHLQQKFDIVPQYVSGLRVSDPDSLKIAEMVLCGMVNTRLVRTLQLNGLEAQGMNGQDRGLIKARKLAHPAGDLGFVGEPIAVRGEVLQGMLAEGIIPVISPICLGEDSAYNVNADHVAGAVARAVGAEKVIFVTNVAGVMANDAILEWLTPRQADSFIANGTITGGMIPKVQTAQHLVAAGVPQITITNLHGAFTNSGTTITAGVV